MATGLLSGGQRGSQGLSAAFGPGSCLRPVEWLSCLMEVFQSGHLAPGDSSRHQGTGLQGEGTDTASHLGVLPVLPGLPSQIPHGTPQRGQLLRNTMSGSLGSPVNTAWKRTLLRLRAARSAAKAPAACQIRLRQAVAQAHTESAFASANGPASRLLAAGKLRGCVDKLTETLTFPSHHPPPTIHQLLLCAASSHLLPALSSSPNWQQKEGSSRVCSPRFFWSGMGQGIFTLINSFSKS